MSGGQPVEVQQHRHPQGAIGDVEAPVDGDDGVVAGVVRHRIQRLHVASEVLHPAGVAHLVVVPGVNLEQVPSVTMVDSASTIELRVSRA